MVALHAESPDDCIYVQCATAILIVSSCDRSMHAPKEKASKELKCNKENIIDVTYLTLLNQVVNCNVCPSATNPGTVIRRLVVRDSKKQHSCNIILRRWSGQK